MFSRTSFRAASFNSTSWHLVPDVAQPEPSSAGGGSTTAQRDRARREQRIRHQNDVIVATILALIEAGEI